MMTNQEISDISYAVVRAFKAPVGCENCWADLHRGCTDDCREDCKRFIDLCLKVGKILEPRITKLQAAAVARREEEIREKMLHRILFIGEEIPTAIAQNSDPKCIFKGYPEELLSHNPPKTEIISKTNV